MNIIQPNYPPPNNPLTPRSASDITDLVIHHSDGPVDQTPLEIDTEERNTTTQTPYSMIPYEYLIDSKGNVYKGRPDLFESGASFGRNPMSVAVCCIGGFQEGDGYTGPPSDAMLNSLLELCIYLHRLYPTIERTYAHRDIAPMFYPNDEGDYSTACCGNVLYEHLPDLKSKIAAALHNT